ncbi:hypothetical protein EMN47_17185 [Prolixibacteraceae bacterium JC049]|nr:hypothetical protein [Prolixibacteraceae bacterium JC049]
MNASIGNTNEMIGAKGKIIGEASNTIGNASELIDRKNDTAKTDSKVVREKGVNPTNARSTTADCFIAIF